MPKMPRSILFFFLLLFSACDNGSSNSNPFLTTSSTPYGVPPFEQIKTEHFIPAFEEGIRQREAVIEQIASNWRAPTFANTIEALEYSGALFDNVSAVFFNYTSSNTSEEIQRINEQISPLLSTHNDNVLLNTRLFARIQTVYDQRNQLGLTSEQVRLVEETYKNFALNGALLPEEQRARFRQINQELALLTIQFGQNLLADVNDYRLLISNEEDLSGLPQSLRDVAALSASDAGFQNSWLFTLQNSSVMPFLSYIDDRELRHTLQQAYIHRGNNDNAFDNKEIVGRIVNLRLELAHLLGDATYAQFSLKNTMAGTVETVINFLNEVWGPALTLANQEALELQAKMDSEEPGRQLEQWDWRYYAEKVRLEQYHLDEEEIRPYLELNTVRNGIFSVVQHLYGLQFIERTDIPKIHPDVQAFEVQEADGSFIGIAYLDFYTRNNKDSGAWMSSYRAQGIRQNGERMYPIVTMTFNFSPPTATLPTLLTHTEMVTFFHEFGHALHGLLSHVTYPSLSGTAVPRDFVELPSQIMENWAREPSVLQTFARHYQTNEPIPQELLDRIAASSTFNQGFVTVELLTSMFLDLEYHSITEPVAESQLRDVVGTIEQRTIAQTGLIPAIHFRHGSTHFSHIFNGGYAAGYYSYLWSGLLDADAFEAFRETGNFFDHATAQAFRSTILERGNTKDALQMYIDFRGREPQIQPLLRQRGLIP